MVDRCFRDITEGASIAIIFNKRGNTPRLMHGFVAAVTPGTVHVKDNEGGSHILRHTKRSNIDGRLLTAVVLPPPLPESFNDMKDCAGHPVNVGDTVAFMEAPSQGFSTSLLIGEVQRVEENGITIVVRSSVTKKYMRIPGEVAVIDNNCLFMETIEE